MILDGISLNSFDSSVQRDTNITGVDPGALINHPRISDSQFR
jgi:hypothetical protein